jgi:prophage maintenance system killer protein
MNQIEIYKDKDNQTQIEVKFEEDTVWLNQAQLVVLFGSSKTNISEHLSNIFDSIELESGATVRKFRTVRKEGKRTISRNIDYYNLDVIISIGYRVNGKRGIQFRQWATQRLKDYLVKGYAINEKRLAEAENRFNDLKQTIALMDDVAKTKNISGTEAQGLLKVLSDFTIALDILDQYDHQTLKIRKTKRKELFRISYKEARKAIEGLKNKFGGSALFGNEKDKSFKSSLDTIYQTFDGKDLYPTIEEKASHLLYFVVKNHSFTDGNKRIAAFLFVWFLERNNLLYYHGKKVIDENALVALTLMIAESKPDDKDMMIKVIVNLINNKQ